AHTPIDAFFRSLAQHSDGRSIGIVLSGSASDGALGVRDIKGVGGITMAQDPATAKYDSMPRAAIATGCVDLILAPEQIGLELARLGQDRYRRPEPVRSTEDDLPDPNGVQLERVFHFLRAASGVDFSQYKLPTIRRRLQRRIALQKMPRLDDYLQRLERDPAEAKNLYRDLLIHVTSFFRDPESFEAMKQTVFPPIISEAKGQRPIRIWVPGCATGEEAYSVAIALLESLDGDGQSTAIQVFATDVSDDAVGKARQGVYPESIAVDVSPDRLRQCFVKVDGHYRVSKLVRDSCIFARQDLTRDPPFSKLDLIVCRNVLIYLGPRLQRKLMNVFHYALKPNGFLIVGGTESAGSQTEFFALADKRFKIYTKRAGLARSDFDVPAMPKSPAQPSRMTSSRSTARVSDVHSDVTRLLVGRYSPPCVLVDRDFQIVQTRGETGPFLELASGDASLDLLKMAREGLLDGLRTALQEARKTLRPARREGLLIKSAGAPREVDVQVLPFGEPADGTHFLVLFESPVSQTAPEKPMRGAKRAVPDDLRIVRMQQELSTSRDYLQTIIHDMEAANEELQSANEEILSSNEELQSTNEELDTAKEELQSTNEELNTVNEELNARNDELSLVNSDLINLLTAVPTPIVIVSEDLKIRRFTPQAERVLNLIPTDIGRPLGDLKPNLDAPDLAEVTRQVIESVTARELESHDRSGRNYNVRIRPYKNQENRIDGAVLSFAEVEEPSRDNADALRQFIHALANAISAGVLILGEDLRVHAANETLLAMLGGGSGASLSGRALQELAGRQWDNAVLLESLEDLRINGKPFAGVRLELSTPRQRSIRIDGARLPGTPARLPLLVLTVLDAG
ncbi:MAG: PAS domain-containing protein, partial [Acidobacteria bacterium]|nr:PAS domain-containing protein [Acidobacteriota bacterium]